MSLNSMLEGVPCQCGNCMRRDEVERTGCWKPFRFHVRLVLDGGATLEFNPRTNNIHAAMLAAREAFARPSSYPVILAEVLDMNISDPGHRVVWHTSTVTP